jgi:hypothetical protein
MNGETFITFGNGLKLIFAGVLGILWWDVRKVGKVKEKLSTIQQDVLTGVKDEYLTRDKHGDLCKIASLEMKDHVSTEIERVITAIKENGKS